MDAIVMQELIAFLPFVPQMVYVQVTVYYSKVQLVLPMLIASLGSAMNIVNHLVHLYLEVMATTTIMMDAIVKATVTACQVLAILIQLIYPILTNAYLTVQLLQICIAILLYHAPVNSIMSALLNSATLKEMFVHLLVLKITLVCCTLMDVTVRIATSACLTTVMGSACLIQLLSK